MRNRERYTIATLAIAVTMAAGCATDIGSDLETVEQAAIGDLARLVVCHVPEGHADNASTIEIDPLTLDAHLEHGDYIGECSECPDSCDEVAALVRGTCDGAGGFSSAPPDFCQTAEAVIAEACAAQCPAPEPETCRSFCDALSGSHFDVCTELTIDPTLCDGGVSTTFDACATVFDCPAPPPPCNEQCVSDAYAQLAACLADPPATLLCPGSPDPAHQTCLIASQSFLSECLFALDGCFGPPTDCHSVCDVEANRALVECIDDPVCLPPDACTSSAEDGLDACVAACEADPPECHDECCNAFEACRRAGGEVAFCAARLDECLPECLAPPIPCEDACFLEYDDCGGDGGPSGFCDGGFFDCLRLCAPDPSTCEDECSYAFGECLSGGGHPAVCEVFYGECLGECTTEPPPCCVGDSCPPGGSFCEFPCDPRTEVIDCAGGCFPADLVGNGTCDALLNCSELDFDGGDC